MHYELVHKPTFTNQLLGLPPGVVPHVLKKVQLLHLSPAPDNKSKKRIHGYKGDVYRIRAGDYRILYTFGDRWIALLGVDNRKDVYKGDKLVVEVPEFDPLHVPNTDDVLQTSAPNRSWLDKTGQSGSPAVAKPPHIAAPDAQTQTRDKDEPPTPLLRELDDAFLRQIRVPDKYIHRLRHCRTVEDLIAADVPGHVQTLVFDAVVATNYDRVLEEPSFRVDSAEDYRRYLDGDLVTFLLKLDPEQEKFVNWAVKGSGPTLLKGGPGTGKTIVAVYRTRSLIRSLREMGVAEPRILFTTYTNSLVASCRQLLVRLLGADAKLVDVRTADNLVNEILRSVGRPTKVIDNGERLAFVERARKRLLDGTHEDRALMASIAHLSRDYLAEEIDKVIVAREHADLGAYRADERAGRRVGLHKTRQRPAVWRLYEEQEKLLQANGKSTFAQNRRTAVKLVRDGWWSHRYDGIVVDEAQDLDPTVLRLLVHLCKSTDRLFLTADPNQSIYGSGFQWADVHAELRFRGRTGVLRRNYRTTAQINAAATSYLAGSELDERDDSPVEYVRTGPRPTVQIIPDYSTELYHLHRFIKSAAKDNRVGFGSCAVLVPTNAIGEAIQTRLRGVGLRARFMPKGAIDLDSSEIKIVTFQSAKGLEFPVVAVAGMIGGLPLYRGKGALAEEDDERHRLGRRVLYVAMTRAVHALRVLVPVGHSSPLFGGFDPRHWEVIESTARDQSPPPRAATPLGIVQDRVRTIPMSGIGDQSGAISNGRHAGNKAVTAMG